MLYSGLESSGTSDGICRSPPAAFTLEAITIFDKPEAGHATTKDGSIHSIASGLAIKISIGSRSDSVNGLYFPRSKSYL